MMKRGDGNQTIAEECWDAAVEQLAVRQIQLLKERKHKRVRVSNQSLVELNLLQEFDTRALIDQINAKVKELLVGKTDLI